MTAYRRPVDAEAVANNFRVFGAVDCEGEPLYAALSSAIADDAASIALVLEAPYRQRRPVLLFAAVHDLLLAGVDHPLASFYETVAGHGAHRDDVDRAAPVLADFCRVHRSALVDALRTRATQTNEVGRSAVLRLALAEGGGASAADPRPLALIDVGCSAGLNLLFDRFHMRYRSDAGLMRSLGPASSPVEITATIRGRDVDPLVDAIAPIVERFGIDLAPLDVRDPRDARWLRACVWPSDRDRQARLAAAIAIACETELALIEADAIDGVAQVLQRLGTDARPVVFHSWVASYFDTASRARFADAVEAMIVDRDGVWISGEAAGTFPAWPIVPLPDDAPPRQREATCWHRTARAANGRPVSTLLARSHPHGRWIDWIAAARCGAVIDAQRER